MNYQCFQCGQQVGGCGADAHAAYWPIAIPTLIAGFCMTTAFEKLRRSQNYLVKGVTLCPLLILNLSWLKISS